MPPPSMSELPQAERGIGAWLRLLRPSHWTKNFFVLAPLLFSGQARDLRVEREAARDQGVDPTPSPDLRV